MTSDVTARPAAGPYDLPDLLTSADITFEAGITYRQCDLPKVEQGRVFHGMISGTARCVNTKRPLTHSLDLREEGLAMQATHESGHTPRKTRKQCTKPGCRSFQALPDLALCKGHIGTELAALSLDRFEARIAEMFTGQFTVTGECWEFSGGLENGYGRICITASGAKHNVLVHNYVLRLRLGREVSPWALHRCNNPPCFRPRHIYEGTPAQNSADRAAANRTATGLRNGNARLTPAQVREIVARYEPGHDRWHRGNAYLLAEEFGIKKAYILMIVKNGHWSLRGEGEEVA